MITKKAAVSSDRHLEPCPFCGLALCADWKRPNPKARCGTEGCMGAQLPALSLDLPEEIAAWNTRALLTKQGAFFVGEALQIGEALAVQGVMDLPEEANLSRYSALAVIYSDREEGVPVEPKDLSGMVACTRIVRWLLENDPIEDQRKRAS